MVVYDVPLLVEKSLQDQYDVVVVVDAGDDVRLHRLVDGRGMAADDARARMASQASRDVRLGVAHRVVPNDGDLKQLRAEVDLLWSWLRSRQVPRSAPGP